MFNQLGLTEGEGMAYQVISNARDNPNTTVYPINRDIHPGIYIPENFDFDPLALTQRLREESSNITFYDDGIVTAIEEDSTGVKLYVSNGKQTDDIRAKQVVIATNGFRSDNNLEGKLKTYAGFVVSFEDQQTDAPNLVVLPDPKTPYSFSYGGRDDGHLWIGGGDLPVTLTNGRVVIDEREPIANVVSTTRMLFPHLANTPPHSIHFGVYACTEDSAPIVGRFGDTSRVFYAVGCNGINTPLLYGTRLLPALMGYEDLRAEDKPLVDLISPARFSPS